MTEKSPDVLGISDEALDAPVQAAVICYSCGPCGICVGISDEALDTPTQHAWSSWACAAPCTGPGTICAVGDEALDTAPINAIPYCPAPPPPPGWMPSRISDEALEAPTQHAGLCGMCLPCGPSDEVHATL